MSPVVYTARSTVPAFSMSSRDELNKLKSLANQFPTIQFDPGELCHVAGGSRSEGWSQEGNLLSVSICPEDWMDIARFSGPQHWINSPLRLVDRHTCLKLTGVIEALSLALNLATKQTHWRVTDTDEDGEERFFAYTNREDADLEAEFYETEAVSEEHLDPSPPIKEWWSHVDPDSDYWIHHGLDSIIAAVALSEPTVAGLYWDDLHAPELLSAPRGGLFQERLAAIEFTMDS